MSQTIPFAPYDWMLVDQYVDYLVQSRQAKRFFTRTSFRDWVVGEGYRGPGWSAAQASWALQYHRTLEDKRRHHVGRSGFGRASKWFILNPSDVDAAEREAVREMAGRLVAEHVHRIIPGSNPDPDVAAHISQVTHMVERQLDVMGEWIQMNLAIHTDPYVSKVKLKAV